MKPDPRIQIMAVEDLIPYAKNSRTHDDAQVAQIAASIREFGFTNPVLIDADGGIIAGHGRVMALTPKQEAFAQAENVYYVYELIDPRDLTVFYIGKGKGGRVKQHAKFARIGVIDNVPKHKRIADIHAAGMAVIERIAISGLTEDAAYKIERGMIQACKSTLTNIKGGTVSNTEAAVERAKYILQHIMSFDRWIETASDRQKHAAENEAGSLRAFYDNSIGFYQGIAGLKI